MFIDKQLGQDRKWINIDSDMIAENSYLYKKETDFTSFLYLKIILSSHRTRKFAIEISKIRDKTIQIK